MARQVDTDGDGLWDTLEVNGIPNLSSTQDRVAKGIEIEMTVNPTRNWRVLANISQQETVQSNTANLMSRIAEEFNQNLLATRIGELPFDASGTQAVRQTNEQWGNLGLVPIRGAKALDDTVSNEQRKWRVTGRPTTTFRREGSLSSASRTPERFRCRTPLDSKRGQASRLSFGRAGCH